MGRNSVGRKNVRRRARSSYLKWVPYAAACPDPLAEADRLIWAGSYTPVPRVLDVGWDEHGSWLLTAAVEAGGAITTSAIEPQWRALAERSAIAVGVGLRRFHDALPTDTCPYLRTAEVRVADLAAGLTAPRTATKRLRGRLRERIANRVTERDAEPATEPATISSALRNPPPVDRLVVCHGDATVPNTLLDEVGRFAAHVDVGDLGVADRWSDIAVTTRSVTRRYGPGLEPLVLAAYGVAPDHERTTYYRALWDAEEAVRTRRVASR
ncbi:phosphotransferase [Promicromonospora sp. Populi]|uniref:phosphotransferase n=1 Tax=Promicromonospora sp. Populi TaxID=3239420 RepID=UPI0034E2B044